MKTRLFSCLALTFLLFSNSFIGKAQSGFDGKKKVHTDVSTSSLNATRIKGSENAGKTQNNIGNKNLKTTLVKDSVLQRQLIIPRDEKVILSSETGLPIYILSKPGTSHSLKTTDINSSLFCFEYLNELKPLLRIDNPEDQFTIKQKSTDRFSKTHIRLYQVYKGIPVYGAEIMVHLNPYGKGELFNGRYHLITAQVDTAPLLSPLKAIENASDHLKKGSEKSFNGMVGHVVENLEKPEATLVIYKRKDLLNKFVLTYHVVLFSENHHRWEYFIDASKGQILYRIESTCYTDGAKTANAIDLKNITRTINTYQKENTYYLLDISRPMYNSSISQPPDNPVGAILTIDMNNTFGDNQSFNFIISSNNSWNNPTAVSAHYNAGFAYDYYRLKHNRNSIDGKGGTIFSIINVPDQETGGPLDNAFWNGRFMCYGNGDVSFKPLALGMDVAGHEMTHGVVENTANLEYIGESGAINESMADIFGTMMDDEDWLIGEDVVLTQAFPSGALRSLSDPHNGGSDLNDRGYQPKNMNEKYLGQEDNEGVHINSGIPNFAFYKYAQAIGKEQAAAIYYKALSDYLTKSSQFIDLRIAVIQAATDIYGNESNEVNQAKIAFDAVGITDGQVTDIHAILPENPGEEYVLVYNTDETNQNTLYRSNINQTTINALTATTFVSRPSVTDDGTIAVFVAGDNTLHAIYTAPDSDPTEFTIQEEQIWSNVVVSKDGNRLAAVTTDNDATIYVYDFISEQWAAFELYNPTYTQGVNSAGPLYADALEFDYSGEYLVYDAFNNLDNNQGENIEYWDVNFIHIWDNGVQDFGDGIVSKLFTSIPENVSIGNPAFSKLSANIIAFDYIDSYLDEYAILGCNIETNDVGIICENNTIGWPSFNKDDSRLAYTAMNGDGKFQIDYVFLNSDKISSDGVAFGMFSDAAWPVYFAVGQRNLDITLISENTQPQITLQCYPNPFFNNITIEIPEKLSGKGTIYVFNPLGQIVFSEYYDSILKGNINLNLDNVLPGYYYIQLKNEQSVASGRIIKLE